MGTLLSGPVLVSALEERDHVFRAGSWSHSQIRGAGYDLRLAGDMLVLPTEPGLASYRAIDKGTDGIDEFTLAPGDSALISTIERCSFGFDVSGTIGSKFRWAAKGLLVLHGAVAHPGYGREQSETDGAWLPKDDERLYFIVANVGPDNITMRKGDSIAYIQLYEVEVSEAKESVPNLGYERLRDRLFRSSSNATDGGLAYFRIVKDLQQEVRSRDFDLRRQWTAFRRRSDADIKDLGRQVTEAQTSVDRVNNASNMVVVFGVFLVSTTILGFALSILTDLIERLPAHIGSFRVALISVLAVIYGASSVMGVTLVTIAVRKTLRTERKSQSPGGAVSFADPAESIEIPASGGATTDESA